MFFGWFDAIFSFIFPILFLLFMGMFFFALISNLRTWNKNNHSPRLYVTFQVESGDRMELEVDGSDYGMLVEGDIGKLSFQGTRYLGFERN
ncbi:MAG: DUF2500 domain-containing protein [Faecalibacterium prausnitzii]|nr:DUF2500 domain-containing protein [Faecalibacterium prausnitzii]